MLCRGGKFAICVTTLDTICLAPLNRGPVYERAIWYENGKSTIRLYPYYARAARCGLRPSQRCAEILQPESCSRQAPKQRSPTRARRRGGRSPPPCAQIRLRPVWTRACLSGGVSSVENERESARRGQRPDSGSNGLPRTRASGEYREERGRTDLSACLILHPSRRQSATGQSCNPRFVVRKGWGHGSSHLHAGFERVR